MAEDRAQVTARGVGVRGIHAHSAREGYAVVLGADSAIGILAIQVRPDHAPDSAHSER